MQSGARIGRPASAVSAKAVPPPVGSPRPRWALTLGRAEAKYLLRDPYFLGGLGLAPLLLLSVGFAARSYFLSPLGAVVVSAFLAAATLLGANHGALRSRRSGTEELFDSAPARSELRTTARLLSVAAPLTIATVLSTLIVAVGWIAGIHPSFADVAVNAPRTFLDVVQGPALVVVAGWLGVALAAWIPSRLAGPVFLLVNVTTVIVVSPWILPQGIGGRMSWHFAHLLGVAIFACGAAYARSRPTPRRVIAIAGGLALAVAGATQQLPQGWFS